MNELYDRTCLLFGEERTEVIRRTRVIIFGVGGVGSWTAECLAREGVGYITLVDSDNVGASNINRQLQAFPDTVGQSKVEVMASRLRRINPEAVIEAVDKRYMEETADEFDLASYDYVIDAIDTLRHKALLILRATSSGAKLFSSMGAALKVDPEQVRVAEFWKVRGCPLGLALRKKFKREKTWPARKFRCVYSEELLENGGGAELARPAGENDEGKKTINGSLAHITGLFGLTLAGLVMRDIYEKVL